MYNTSWHISPCQNQAYLYTIRRPLLRNAEHVHALHQHTLIKTGNRSCPLLSHAPQCDAEGRYSILPRSPPSLHHKFHLTLSVWKVRLLAMKSPPSSSLLMRQCLMPSPSLSERESEFFWLELVLTRKVPLGLPGMRSHFSASARATSPKYQLQKITHTCVQQLCIALLCE